MAPLVTCVMPTRNRRRFVPLAIDCFLRQDYSNAELLVADDGSDAVEDLLPRDRRVRYLRLDPMRSIGTKRNVACAAADGDIIVHWDDDDWSAAWRVSYQVESLLGSGADICGLGRILFFDPVADRAWEYVYPEGGRPWVHGATLAYRASFWRLNPFPDIPVGEDTRFVWTERGQRIDVLQRRDFFVGTIHAANTSPKQTMGERWRAASSAEILRTIGEGWDGYCRTFGVRA